MHIDMWADISCPWCYLEVRHLRRAINEFPHAQDITVSLHAFFLDPELDQVWEKSHAMYRHHQHEEEIPDILAQYDRFGTLGRAEGVVFDFDRLIVAPTNAAWQVVNFAREEDHYTDQAKGANTYSLKVYEAIARAHFEMALNIADPEVLIGCAQDIGLDPQSVKDVLADSSYTDQAISEYHLGLNYGINAVPTMVINQQYVVQELHPVTALTNILNTAWAEQTGKVLS